MTRPGCLLLVCLLLGACNALPSGNAGWPLDTTGCAATFAPDYQLRATLTVRRDAQQQTYFLAVRTVAPGATIALISLQGIPLYRLECGVGEPSLSRQARLPGGLTSAQLLLYLQAIYLPESRARGLLRPGWQLWSATARRSYRAASDSAGRGEIKITYSGSAPWFETVQLVDQGNQLTLELQILEQSRVLPE